MTIRNYGGAIAIATHLIFAPSLYAAHELVVTAPTFDIPSVPQIPPCEKCFDIIGVKTGPGCSAIKTNSDNERWRAVDFKLSDNVEFHSPDFPNFKIYRFNDSDGAHRLDLTCGPPAAGDLIYKITRTHHYRDRDLPTLDAFKHALFEKYGEPSFASTEGLFLYYEFQLSADLSHSVKTNRKFRSIEDIDVNTGDYVGQVLASDVGLVVQAEISTSNDHLVTDVTVRIVDYNRYMIAYDTLRKWAESYVEKAKAALPSPGAAKPLKL
ncbi:hypothetical protein ACU8OS_35305 (plasmid) [Rhizobium leguminosarum]